MTSTIMLSHDWLMATPKGQNAARVAYALFDGVAPAPEVPSAPRKRKRA